MKAYWHGTVACDFLSFLIKLYTAVTPKEPRCHYLHAQCRTPLEYLRHCPQCGTDVSGEDIVRGYEYEDALVVVNDSELAALTPKPEPVMILRQCVHAYAIDPVSFDRAFYVAPGIGAKRAYAVLHEALRQAGMVALGTVTFREHDRHILLRPAADGVLVLHTLFAAQDLLDLAALPLPQHPASGIDVHAARVAYGGSPAPTFPHSGPIAQKPQCQHLLHGRPEAMPIVSHESSDEPNRHTQRHRQR